jgi:Dimerisation domain
MTQEPRLRPETVERLAMAVYPSFAMLAGMELDVFTTVKDGPLTAEQVAAALGIDPATVKPLLYALVATGLLSVDGDLFANGPEAHHFLVRGQPEYIGMRHQTFRRRWQTVLGAAESIRSGVAQRPRVYAEMSPRSETPTTSACTPRPWRPGAIWRRARSSRGTAASWTSGAVPAASPSR